MGRLPLLLPAVVLLHSCAGSPDKHTLAELRTVEPDTSEVLVDDSLLKAMEGYRRFLEETPTNAKTPEAMRRLADLQIEKEYGIIGGDRSGDAAEDKRTNTLTALPASNADVRTSETDSNQMSDPDASTHDAGQIADHTEALGDFENRAAGLQALPDSDWSPVALPGGASADAVGPREAVETYQRILKEYPHYERNDQVLYQMARAYDELAEPDKAMEVMERLISQYGQSAYSDEVYFRRAEYFFVRKKYLDAEEAYSAVVTMGAGSDFYELALYKLGWSLYKQELYEEALHQYVALLDYELSIGYDFERVASERVLDTEGEAQPAVAVEGADDERRVADTFRVISLAFSNLGGPEVLSEYFGRNGNRVYEDRIYSNLGEFYLSKLRYNDAATVYRSFAEQNPFHRKAPHFGMRVVEIYDEGGFAQLVVEAKQDFASSYGLDADYWQYFDIAEADDVLSYLKTNLQDLAGHYHSLYQDVNFEEEQPQNYAQALLWYGQFLDSFPQDSDTPSINYQLADLLLEHEDFPAAAREYERTAYGYADHEQAPAAGYAAIYAHREHLEVVDAADEVASTQALVDTVESSLRFAETFPDHEQAAVVLGAAAADLYAMQDYQRAIDAASQLIERYGEAEVSLRRSAWSVVANSSFELTAYVDAELAYSEVLALTPEEDETRQGLYDNLAAAIYKQGEEASAAEDHRTAANHYLRIKDAAPASSIRPSAEYDAANALITLEDWTAAAEVFRGFRDAHPGHELQPEVTKQLAFVYRQAGELSRSAQEYELVALDAEDPELRRQATLMAGELFEEAEDERALGVYQRYVDEFPRPIDLALEIRFKIAGIFDEADDVAGYHDELRRIVSIDADAGADRTPRTMYLAGKSALVLAEPLYEHFTELTLSQPFAESLAEKQARMDTAMEALEQLVSYQVAEVTAAATFYMAEIYSNFGLALLDSERPTGLSAAENADYELAIEEEAFPFEERAIEVHEENVELMTAGNFNSWVQKSLNQLATLMPGRYAKAEISSGFIGPVEVFAYRSPGADAVVEDPAGELSAAPADEEPGNPEPGNVEKGRADVSAVY